MSEETTKKPGEDTAKTNAALINEVQLLLAEKRTSLAVMRTGIAFLALPLSIVSVLIATSKYYDVLHVLHWLIPLSMLNTAMVLFGGYLIVRSIIRMHRYDQSIQHIKRNHSVIGQYLD